MSGLAEQCDALLAMTGELTDPELIEATRRLRDASADYDAAGERFEAAGREVQRLLEAKLKR